MNATPFHLIRSRFLFVAILLHALAGGGGIIAQQTAPGDVRLTIFHYNDFHSQNLPYKIVQKDSLGNQVKVDVGGYAFLKALLDQSRSGVENSILLNAGDDFQGTPVSTVTKGRSQIALLDIMQPDAMTLGNHEFDYGRDTLTKNLRYAEFPVISANLWDKSVGAPFVPRYRVLHCGGLTIGVIGMAPRDLPTLTLRDNIRDIDVLDPAMAARQAITELRHDYQPDLIVVLSHLGVDEDSTLAASVDGINVIVGGHSHTPLFKPMQVHGAYIVQAGSRGRWLGRLDLVYNRAQHRLVSGYGRLLDVRDDALIPDPVMKEKVAAFESEVDAGLGEVIGRLDQDWVRSHGAAESNVGDWMADVVRDFTKADVAFINSGGIRKDMLAGPITLRDMWEISPFGNELVTFRVTGSQLLGMLRHQGGKQREFCQVSGLKYSYNRKSPPEKALEATVAGGPVDPDKSYLVGTSNFVASHLNDVFGLPENLIAVTPVHPAAVDREVFIQYIRHQKTIRSMLDGRIRIINE